MERELFVLLFKAVDALPGLRVRPPKRQFSDRDILLVWFWAVIHDRPVDWACRRCNWPWHDRTRPLPSGATMSRRLRTERLREALRRVLVIVGSGDGSGSITLVIDGKPLPVSGHSADRDVGVGRLSGGMGRGYKLHMIADLRGKVLVHEVAPANVSEITVTRRLLERLEAPGARLLADRAYDVNALYDIAASRGVRFIAAKRFKNSRALGHKYQSPHRLSALALQASDPHALRDRRRIEGHFGTLGNVIGGLAPLPNSVRGLERVTRWVTAKLVIDALHRARRAQKRAA